VISPARIRSSAVFASLAVATLFLATSAGPAPASVPYEFVSRFTSTFSRVNRG
jgi:hypothetical protein